MYTTSSAQNTQHQWTEAIAHVNAPSYINVQAYWTFAGNTLTSIGGNTHGCKAFLCIKWSHILFSLATCNLTQIENQTPSGQTYKLILTCTFSAGILVTLQSMTKTVVGQVKALDKAISGRQVGQAKGPWLTRRIQTTDQGMKFSFTANTRDRLD